MKPVEKLIIALDLPSVEAARKAVDAIGDSGGFYKIGYQLAPIGGFELARSLVADGKRVFVDMKLHDIGATVERGVKSFRTLGADFLTVHAEPDVVKGAVAGRGDDPKLKIMAVTVLTSLDEASIREMGIDMSVANLVLKRTEIAMRHGADGVIASAREAAAIRARFGDDLLIATPGVRPAGAAADDQKRVVSPREALTAGADHIVVGRPVIAAADPGAAARAILAEIGAL